MPGKWTNLSGRRAGPVLAGAAMLMWLPLAVLADQLVRFAPFHLDRADPTTIYLVGDIDLRASLNFQRILDASGDPQRIVLVSNGGLVHVGLTIAMEVRRRGLSTHIPAKSGCYSSCAFIWFAGVSRHAEGEVGVHQLASRTGDLETGQLAISDIVDVLTGFDVPNEVIVRMLQTPASEMHVFGTDDLERFGLIGQAPSVAFATVPLRPEPEPEPVPTQSGVQPDALPPESRLPPPVPAPLRLDAPPIFADPGPADAETPPSTAESAALRPRPAPREDDAAQPTVEQRAIDFVAQNNRDWSRPNAEALGRIGDQYADRIEFFGTSRSHAQVMEEKRAFADRWPVRAYALDLTTASATCDSSGCVVTGHVDWDARSPVRGAVSRGRSTIELTLVREGQGFVIAGESGRVVARH